MKLIKVKKLSKLTLKVFVVVGVWEGTVQAVKVCFSPKDAQKIAEAMKKQYAANADKWEDEPDENMNYQVSVNEVGVI